MASIQTALHPPREIQLLRNESFGRMRQVLANRVVSHVLFWIVLFGLTAMYVSSIEDEWQAPLYNFLLRMPFVVACCYANLYFLLPKFYYPDRLVLYALLLLTLILATNALNLFVLDAFADTPLCPQTYEAVSTFTWNNYVYKAFYLVSIVGLTSGIKLSKDYLLEKQKYDAIEKEKLKTELSLLKSQIHPHFFFNTLNNLYALTMKKSDKAPDMLLKLSDLMSYSLYESESSVTSLSKEIEHLRSYIDLESLRFGSKLKIDFTVTGVIENKSIPPLIFLPFIENSFKHVAVKQGDLFIAINIVAAADTITLEVKNPFVAGREQERKKGGLGLKNVQRRLALLYGDVYHLEMKPEENLFCVNLQIPLA